MLQPQLIEAYKNTLYKIYKPPLEIKVGSCSSALDELLQENGIVSWTYITAYNPFSEELTDEENSRRHAELIALLTDHTYFEGEGLGTDPEWKPEKSILIIGITKEDAKSLGTKFQQNAIVYGELHQPAELLLLV